MKDRFLKTVGIAATGFFLLLAAYDITDEILKARHRRKHYEDRLQILEEANNV